MRMFKVLVAVALVIVVVAVIVPFLIPLETYKQEIAAQVKKQTGRDMVIGGNVRITVFPSLGVHMEKVTFSNPAGFTSKNMLEVEGVTVEVATAALMEKKIIIKRFIFDRPLIHLEINTQGKPNWQFEKVRAVASSEASFMLISSANAAEEKKPLKDELLRNLQLTNASILMGTIRYIDIPSKISETFENVDLQLAMESLDSPLSATGNATWNSQKIDFDTNFKNIRELTAGKPVEMSALISAPALNLDYKGTLKKGGALEGEIKLDTSSAIDLARWTGNPINWNGQTPLKLSAAGKLSTDVKGFTLRDATVKLDDIRANGFFSGSYGKTRPSFQMSISTPKLDLNPYLPKAVEPKTSSIFIRQAYAAPATWNDEPIDFSALKQVDLSVKLLTNQLIVQNMHYDKVSLEFQLNAGKLNGKLNEMHLYGGTAAGNFAMAVEGQTAYMSKNITLTGLDAKRFFMDFAHTDHISGQLDASFNIMAGGQTQRQILSALGGGGQFRISDGVISGVDLDAMLKNVQSAFSSALNSSNQKTPFSQISGNFTIGNGVINNADGLFVSKTLKVHGAGNIDVPQQRVSYRLTPERVEAVPASDAPPVQKGLSLVPVIIEGPFDNLKFRPDLQAVVKEVLQDPEKLRQTVKDVKQQLKDGKLQLKDIKKGTKEDLRNLKNPENLKNLLNNLGGR